MTTTQKPMRQAMPKVAEFIDACREVFGDEPVHRAIRNGMAGGTDFYASEGGHTLGCLLPPPGARFTADQLQLLQKRPPHEDLRPH